MIEQDWVPSPERLDRQRASLLVIDVQQRLVPHVRGHQRLVWNVRRLLEGAGLLQIPISATEQYPEGLGPTVPPLASYLTQPPLRKTCFSAAACPGLVHWCTADGRDQVVLAGVETHVCVLQTALDLLANGLQVFVPCDAVASRHKRDHKVAVRRLEAAGGVITTTESVLFEWCRDAADPHFKQISALVKQTPS